MSNYQSEISLSKKLSEKRIQKAKKLLGVKTVNRIIGIALFLLGGKREHISQFLGMPIGTFFSLLTRFHNKGVPAFIQQRAKQQQKPEKAVLNNAKAIEPTQTCLEIVFGEQRISFNIPVGKNKLIINSSNPLQFKAVIVSFMSSGFLTAKQASELLGLTERHVRELGKKLQTDDITSLIDKRQGQQKDYVFSEAIKAELIQQYSANIVSGGSTSSRNITKQVNDACNCSVSERAVRQHILKLGLNKIKKSLPNLLNESKKNSNP
jgi:hypothetical protein